MKISFRFTNIVCKFPGSTHDAFILQSSSLPECVANLEDDGWLLGDSGYPLKEWLMTPVTNPRTGQERRYNSSHCKTRNVIERAFGVLKARFRYLIVFSSFSVHCIKCNIHSNAMKHRQTPKITKLYIKRIQVNFDYKEFSI